MPKRLNDTAAIASRLLRGGDTSSPDAGAARMCRGVRAANAMLCEPSMGTPGVRSADAGSESLRGATAYLGERIGTRGQG